MCKASSGSVARSSLVALSTQFHHEVRSGEFRGGARESIAARAASGLAPLDHATKTNLASEPIVADDAIRLPRFLPWFQGDFGGRSGIKRILRNFGILEAGERRRIRYHTDDWSLALDDYFTASDHSFEAGDHT